jgi:hypothetical protein
MLAPTVLATLSDSARKDHRDGPVVTGESALDSVKKLSVLLPTSLHKRAKRRALLNDQTLTDLIIGLLTTHLDTADQQDAHDQLSPR